MTFKVGTTGNNTLNGTDGADFLFGLAGNDTLSGGKGNDLLDGGYGDDSFKLGSGNTTVRGGPGSDTVTLAKGNWFIAPSSYFGSPRLVNQDTGQVVFVRDVETLKLGDKTVHFVFNPDDLGQTLTGTDGADYVISRSGDDTITTGKGDDWIVAGGGIDSIKAGSGNDIIDLQATYDNGPIDRGSTVDAGSGNDAILLYVPYNVVSEIAANITGGSGTDVVYLDTSSYGAIVKNGTIRAYDYNGIEQNLAYLDGVEQVVNFRGDQVWTHRDDGSWTDKRVQVSLKGTSLSEDVKGTSGNDTLKGGGGYDRFLGGKGTDTVQIAGRLKDYAAQLLYDYSTGTRSWLVDNDGLTGVRFLNAFDVRHKGFTIGSDIEKLEFDDATYAFKIAALSKVSTLGTSGNDLVIVDSTTNNTIPKGSSAKLSLGNGDDVAYGLGSLTSFSGGAGNDKVSWIGAVHASTFTGGDGNDELRVSSVASGNGTTRVEGGTGNDTIELNSDTGSSLADGGDGDDFINVHASTDVLGGSGNDRIVVYFPTYAENAGATVDGGKGDDLLVVDDRLISQVRITETKAGFAFYDKLSKTTIELKSIEGVKFAFGALDLKANFNVYDGSGSANTKTGTSGVDLMHGGAGKDTLDGGKGDDVLAGDDSDDTLKGGDGNDFLDGGRADDTLTGGKGQDQFFFDIYNSGSDDIVGNDIITDFHAGKGLEDVLVLTSGNHWFDSFEDMMHNAVELEDGSTFFRLGIGSLTVEGVSIDQFVADDFLFV